MTKKHYLSICAVVKNEERYLLEWVAFHLLQGVQHFYLYENESTDGTWKILDKLEKKGYATIEKVSTKENTQRYAYQKFLKELGHETKWCAFIDCDEFLHTYKYDRRVTHRVEDILKTYEQYPAVAVNWMLYGSSLEIKYRPKLVIERFVCHAKELDQHVKSIVQPEFVIDTGNNAHYFKLKGRAVNGLKEELPEEYYWTKPTDSPFRINHYHTKSYEEYLERKIYKDVDGADRGSVEERFKAHDVNEVLEEFTDETIYAVKAVMRTLLDELL